MDNKYELLSKYPELNLVKTFLDNHNAWQDYNSVKRCLEQNDFLLFQIYNVFNYKNDSVVLLDEFLKGIHMKKFIDDKNMGISFWFDCVDDDLCFLISKFIMDSFIIMDGTFSTHTSFTKYQSKFVKNKGKVIRINYLDLSNKKLRKAYKNSSIENKETLFEYITKINRKKGVLYEHEHLNIAIVQGVFEHILGYSKAESVKMILVSDNYSSRLNKLNYSKYIDIKNKELFYLLNELEISRATENKDGYLLSYEFNSDFDRIPRGIIKGRVKFIDNYIRNYGVADTFFTYFRIVEDIKVSNSYNVIAASDITNKLLLYFIYYVLSNDEIVKSIDVVVKDEIYGIYALDIQLKGRLF